MSETKCRISQVIVFMMIAISSFGCRNSGVNLNPAIPSGSATSPQAAVLSHIGQHPVLGIGTNEPDGFTQYDSEPGSFVGAAIPIDIDSLAARTISEQKFSIGDLDKEPDEASDELIALREDSVLTGSITPSGTRPGGQRLDIRPRNNPEAADLLDHWGHRRGQALVDGFSLNAPAAGSDAMDLRALQTAARERSEKPIAPNLQDGDAVSMLGTRRGVTYGRWAGGPADTLSIDFDFSGASPLLTDAPSSLALVLRAGKAWSHRIADTWIPWNRSEGDFKGFIMNGENPDIEARVGPGGEISTELEIDFRDENLSTSASRVILGQAIMGTLPPNDSWEPRFGSIGIQRDFILQAPEAWVFSVITHEIGHVLGAWTAHSFPQRLSTYIDKTTGIWNGPNVVALYGGSAPFQDASDPEAWVNGERAPNATAFDFGHSGVCASLMAYCSDQAAVPAFLPHAIDFAFLADIGMTITDDTDRPETYGLAGWTDYAAFTVSVSRQLQIALADPLSLYGYGLGPWQALEVVDLLQAEVDAFGYLSTGNFRSSHAAKGPDGIVHYAGGLIGAALDRSGLPPVTGNAALSIDLATLDGTASFTSLTVNTNGSPEVYSSESLHYPIELSANSIVGTGVASTLQADFYGPKHEEVAGILHDSQAGLLASFGATLDERPSREEVISSADYLVGESYQTGPIYYSCGADSTCESRHIGPNGLTDPVADTRENVLAATTGWASKNAAKLTADHGFLRIARHLNISTDGARGRHLVDGFTGTLEHVMFWVGDEVYSNWTTEPGADLLNSVSKQHGFLGTLSGSLPSERVRWSGLMVGYPNAYGPEISPYMEGRVIVDFWLSTKLMDMKFSEITDLDGLQAISDFSVEGIGIEANGIFRGGNEAAYVNGAFFGPSHEELAAKFAHFGTQVQGSLGARRVEDTAASEEGSSPATQAPIVDLEDTLYIGTNVAPPEDQLTARDDYNGVAVSSDELIAESLGSWGDTSFHLVGELDFERGEVSFGVSVRNGLPQPWASGPKPWANLADNSALFGTVTWNGALLGVTPFAKIVTGGALLTVELATLAGQLDFTDMEQWGTNEAPGAVGSGTMWGDGDLRFTIKVSENTFIQTGGDEGKVTGAFFGPAHEAMGGVLERADLAAGFGGKR